MPDVDIGWLLGLALLGLVYLFMGLRMGIGAPRMWHAGHLKIAVWMVWNAMVAAAIPAWQDHRSRSPLLAWALLGLGILHMSRVMYTTLVHYTGARPAEYFSEQKRPAT